MGAVEETKLELQDDDVSNSPLSVRKMHTFEHIGSLAAMAQTYAPRRTNSRVLMSIYIVIVQAKINVLLPFGPLAVMLHYLTGKHGWVFLFSLIGITPLAERLGYATEQLACYTGPTVGGLLNATFGNATEMIISIYALKNGMIRVVQQSLLGSILSNMLLVLGCAFFAGGIVHCNKDQVFNKASAVVNSGLLLMAVMGLLFPAVLHFTHSEVQYGKSEVTLSRFSSCIMLVAYASYLFFQLKSHRSLYNPIVEEEDNEDDADQEEAPEITQWEAICWLSVLTIWISILSGYLVDAIQDITLGVAIGSSTQISMFVIPFCVVIGWMMGKQMDLNFQLFETATLFITVLVVAFMLQEGTANYFKGLMLILCYLIVAASFFVHIDPAANDD
ncbi:vacuolar cation/proton exchanger 2-like isoform X2 [Typha latifolia]|uniref:vacuolar cation/proton exchanger 2-like isoform X2 n=1 Tax=Typha latifolia TaxID=4733 RepID=UPI003C2D3FEE